jgi:hypothetical protein
VGLHQGRITARNAGPGLAVSIDLPNAHPPGPTPDRCDGALDPRSP